MRILADSALAAMVRAYPLQPEDCGLTPPFTAHLQCPAERLACNAARWQSSSRLGPAIDVSPTQFDGPAGPSRFMQPIALVVFLVLVALAVMLAAILF